MQRVTGWQTNDGLFFDTQEKAVQHELRVLLEEHFERNDNDLDLWLECIRGQEQVAIEYLQLMTVVRDNNFALVQEKANGEAQDIDDDNDFNEADYTDEELQVIEQALTDRPVVSIEADSISVDSEVNLRPRPEGNAIDPSVASPTGKRETDTAGSGPDEAIQP